MKIAHTIPERSDQIARRKAKGTNGGRPPAFSGRIYKHRNTVERSFNRFKHWRGNTARYDKYALSYLGGVTWPRSSSITAPAVNRHDPDGVRIV